MKKYIIVLLALLIFSCDEDNIVKDDRIKTKKEGWVNVGEYDIIDESDVTLDRIYIFDDVFYATGYYGIFEGFKQYYKSTDFGLTWNEIIQTHNTIRAPNYYFYRDLILKVGQNVVWTNDEGSNYYSKEFDYDMNTRQGEYSICFQKINKDLSLLLTNYGIYKVENNLQKWTLIDSSFVYLNKNNSKQNEIAFIQFFDDKVGYLANVKDSTIYYTNDGLKTIKKTNISFSRHFEESFFYSQVTDFRDYFKILNEKIAYFWNDDGIYKTINSGETWTKLNEIVNILVFSKIQVVSEDIIYLQRYVTQTNSELLASTDGGLSFRKQELPDSIKIKDFHFLDKNTGWAIGSNREILKTTSGGFKDN